MGCVYVAVSAAGVIKVGSTKNAVSRVSALKTAFKKFGDVLDRIEFCDDIESYTGAEFSALCDVGAIAKPYFGREWFEGITFDAAFEIAKRSTNVWRNRKPLKPLTKKQIEALRIKRAEEDEARRIGQIRFEAQVQERKAIRAIRYAQVAEVAARKASQLAISPHTPRTSSGAAVASQALQGSIVGGNPRGEVGGFAHASTLAAPQLVRQLVGSFSF